MRRLTTLTRPTRLLTAVALAGALALTSSVTTAAQQPNLGTASNYAVMAATTITSTGPTVVTSNVALNPGTAVTGFPPGVVNGAIDVANAEAVLAQTDLAVAYGDAAAEPTTVNLTGTDLGGLTLTPGTYTLDSSAQLTGAVVLDGQGSTNATFVFQVGSTLTTASNSSVSLINGAGACAVFWQVGSSATLGTATSFQGTIMATTSITMNTGASIGIGGLNHGGRALALNGAVTLDSNVINAPASDCTFAAAATPTPVLTQPPSPVPTIVPTTAPSTPPSAVPSNPAPSDVPAPSIGSPAARTTTGDAPASATTVPVNNVPGVGPAAGLPDTRIAGSPETATTTVALLALTGIAAMVALSATVEASRRRR